MRIAFISAALLLTNAATAATPIDGLYSSIFGGYAYIPNNINNTRLGLTRTDANYQSGFNAGGSIGYKSNPLRYEGELTYLTADLDDFRINGIRQTGITGYSSGILAMANIYYDFPEYIPAIQPYLGIGLGYAWVKAKLNASGPEFISDFSGSNGIFAYQPRAGLTYNFAENFALDLGYRYVATERAGELGKIFQAHLANLGIVYRYCENRYK